MTMFMMPTPDYERRFGGLQRLFGPEATGRLAAAHVMVAGIGGVGTWCAEALARSGVGTITLVDLDHVSESNVNRQLHALTDTIGQSKVVAMAQRVAGINPDCVVHAVDDFVTSDNIASLLEGAPDVVIDCTDQVAAKIAMILEGRLRNIPVLVCGGAGGKTDPLTLQAGDLSRATHDALLSRLRNVLRRQHGYPKASQAAGKPAARVPRMGVWALWLQQPVILPGHWGLAAGTAPDRDTQGDDADAPDNITDGAASLQGLSCAGYGSVVTVTATMGMAAANRALAVIVGVVR